jgi:general secretion pathway protein H
MSATGKPGAQGFTLIEALVVVGVTALLSGLMFPRLQGMVGAQEFRTARSQVLLGVQETRALAIRRGEGVAFVVSADGHGYRIEGDAPVVLPDAVSLIRSEGRGGVYFYADGTSNGGRIALSAGKRREEFIIFPATGLIAEARR